MALSFKEKRDAQASLTASLKVLALDTTSFADKRREQKNISLQLSILSGTKPATGNSKLDELIAGKYDDYSPENFMKVLEEIGKELNEEDIALVKEPVMKYVELHKDLIVEGNAG